MTDDLDINLHTNHDVALMMFGIVHGISFLASIGHSTRPERNLE